jgi:hypothetical protein
MGLNLSTGISHRQRFGGLRAALAKLCGEAGGNALLRMMSGR